MADPRPRALGLLAAIALWATLALGAEAEPLRVAVISDLNGRYGSTDYAPRVSAAVRRIIALRPDLVISTGDMVAGQRRDPRLNEAELDAMWAAFHAAVTRPLADAGIPFAITPGNHDASAYSGFAQERARYAEAWPKPGDLAFVDADRWPFSYAFEMGGALFVSLDATTIGALPEDEMAWLDRLLAEHGGDRTVTVFGHLPLWPFAVGREQDIIGDPALEALFARHDVDLHLSGHHHAFYPGEANGMLFVSQACLGGGPRRLIGEEGPSSHAVTLVRIDDGGGIEVEALTGPGFDAPLDFRDLPAAIRSPERTLTRMDLAPQR